MKSLRRVPLLATPWTAAYQGPPSLGFPRQEYWSFSFNISPSNEHPGLISFRMDWLDILEVQGALKSLLQHRSSKASILHSAFFIVQLTSIHAAAAAKLLHLCPTLCNPTEGSPPGSPIPGILQVRTLEWVAISFSNA